MSVTPLHGASVPAPAALELRRITKRFGPVTACEDVSLVVQAGQRHALLGENGAGKSTLIKVAGGLLQPDGGEVLVGGKPAAIRDPAVARRLGIGIVFQHFASFEALSVAENLALALPDLPLSEIRRMAGEATERLGLRLDLSALVARLSAGERQRVEIVRCLMQQPRVLILDEPTSVLTPQEAEALFAAARRLSDDGVAIVHITHRLEEVRRFCEAATILRRGRVVATCDPRRETAASLAEKMIGETALPLPRRERLIGAPRLQVRGLTLASKGGTGLHDVSLVARKGEILGIAGVAGEGQDALFAALSGERRISDENAILIDGKPAAHLGPEARRRLGAAFAPEDRLGHAAVGALRLSDNLRITRRGLAREGRRAMRKRLLRLREEHDVRGAEGDPKAGTLSGGNLQKLVMGRELDRRPGVLVASQPTWGVDAGAAAAIRTRLIDLAAAGSAVVVISQDLDEVFAICDRIAVIQGGRLSEARESAELTPESVGLMMAGENGDAAPPAALNVTRLPDPAPPRAGPPEQPGPEVRLGTGGSFAVPWTPPETGTRVEGRPC